MNIFTQEWNYNDGGRENAGYKGITGDCVTRAIAIATGRDYQTVYDDLTTLTKTYVETHNNKVSRSIIRRKNFTPRRGVHKPVYMQYLKDLGWEWTPTMLIGQGVKVHLKADELPKGAVIARVSKHITAIIDGVIQDTGNPSRGGTRAVYGYWTKP